MTEPSSFPIDGPTKSNPDPWLLVRSQPATRLSFILTSSVAGRVASAGQHTEILVERVGGYSANDGDDLTAAKMQELGWLITCCGHGCCKRLGPACSAGSSVFIHLSGLPTSDLYASHCSFCVCNSE